VRIAEELATVSGRRVVLRKLLPDLKRELIRLGQFLPLAPDTFTHFRDVPEDVYPQVVISATQTLALATRRFMKTRNQLRHFERYSRPRVATLSSASHGDIADLATRWQEAYQDRQRTEEAGIAKVFSAVDPTAYTVFAEVFGDRCDANNYFGKLLYVRGVAVGFTFAGRVSQTGAALYCSLSLRTFRGSAEYLLMELLAELAGAGVDYLNMGGSETPGLFAFKRKFAVTDLRSADDLEFVGPVT
jgi:hypothetical protein